MEFSWPAPVYLVGYAGFALIFLSFFFNSRRTVLLTHSVAYILLGAHFFGLSALSGAFLVWLQSGRNVMFLTIESDRIQKALLLVFLVLYVVVMGLTWDGYKSLLPYIGSTLGTLAAWVKNTFHLRLLFFVSAWPWLFYGYLIDSLPVMFIQTSFLVSTLFNMIRFDWLKK